MTAHLGRLPDMLPIEWTYKTAIFYDSNIIYQNLRVYQAFP